MLKRFPIFIIVLFCLLAATSNLLAQDNTSAKSGSFYSSIGFGYPVDIYSPSTMGIGVNGVSNYNGYSPSISNPAQWGLTSYTQGNIMLGLDRYNSIDNTAKSESTMLGIESFQVVFPLVRNKLGFSASFSPLARADYKRRETGFIDPLPGLGQDDVEYIITTLGTGGLNRFEIGLGYKPVDNISLGYAFSANVLAIENNITPLFSDIQYTPSPYEVDFEGYNFGHRFGLFLFKSDLLREDDQLSFGASLSLPVTIDSEKSISSFRTINGQRQLIPFLEEGDSEKTGTIKLPLEFNTGLTYNLNRFSNLVAEFQLQKWDNAKFTFDPSQQEFFKDRVRTGLGYQYHAYRAERRNGFFSNFKYSVGTTFDNGHLSIEDQNIETILLHAGIGLVSSRSASSVDLSFHYGIRGTDSSNLVKENIWGFKLSLNLAEFMFLQQKFQ